MRIDSRYGPAPGQGVIVGAVLLMMAVWAINFIVVKIALRYLPGLTLAEFRVVSAAVCMILIYPMCRRLPMFKLTPEQAAQRKTWRDYWTFAYLGFFGVTVNQICFTFGLRYTNVSHSSIIVGMGPIYALVLAVLFGLEKPTVRKALGMTISLVGVIILASGAGISQRSPTLLGDAITMCGSLGFAMYVVLGKRVAGKYDALTMTFWNYVFGGLLVLPFAVRSAFAMGGWGHWIAIPPTAWLCIAYTSLFSSTLAYLFYFWVLRYVDASQITAFSYLIPVVATALSILLLGEHGTWSELLGGALALAGVYWIEASRGR